MALRRIKFNATATTTGAYTVPINPIELELNCDIEHSTISVLDGPSVIQNKYFDNRPYVLSWKQIPTSISGFTTMMETLQGYQGEQKYVHFGDIDYRVTGTGWELVRVEDVKITINSGGSIRYNVEVYLLPEE